MNQTIKNFWAHRRQNAWIIIEIALVAVLSFHFLDGFVVTAAPLATSSATICW